MKVLLNENGYIISYALIGDLVDSIELPDPKDIGHFQEHFSAYQVKDGDAVFDEKQEKAKEGSAVIQSCVWFLPYAVFLCIREGNKP